MCGFEDFIEPILDVGATLTGNPELIPLINAGVSTGEGLASGKGFGQSLEGGALSGVEALAGQEVAGAVGIGGGNSIFNNALGIDISPSATGLPDIGGSIQNSLGIGGSGTPSSGTGTPTTGGAPDANASFLNGTTGTPSGSPAPTSGGVSGVQAAPASVGASSPGGDVTGSFNSSDFSSGPAGSSGINQALSSSTITPSTSGGSFNSGGDFSSGSSSSATGGSSSSNTGFLSGSSNTGATNIGQGPTVASAPSANTAPASTESSFSKAISDPTLGNIGKALGNNASLITAGAGLGKDILTANTPLPGENQLKTQANQLNTLGQQNEGYLASGTLPPGVQSGITSATQSAIAAIKSRYASMGMSGSSAEQQDIANATQQAQTQGANIAMSLLNQGVSETGMSSQIYQELMKNAMTTDQNFSSAFTNLASAVGGGSGGGTTIKIGA